MNYDRFFDSWFYPGGVWNSGRWRSFARYKVNKLLNIRQWFDTRFNYSSSYKETIVRIHEKIEERPVCKTCGNPVKFGYAKNGTWFTKYCCHQCAVRDKEVTDKMCATQKERYGSVGNQAKGRQTKLECYGSETYNNATQGAKNRNYKEIMTKGMATKIAKYGSVKNFQEHLKQMRLEQHGWISPWEVKEYRDKCKQTCIERYGDPNYHNDAKISVTKATFTSERWKEIQEKSEQTRFERYGNPHYNNQEKSKLTLIEKFGTCNPFKTPNGLLIDRKELAVKAKETKLKQGTNVKSKAENEIHNRLVKLLGKDDVKREYRSDAYPFFCDFFIPSKDLYIECNFHQSHGGKPFESLEIDKETIEYIRKYWYENGVKTFTQRDPLKRKIAKDNNLNYIEFWTLREAKEWIREQYKKKAAK